MSKLKFYLPELLIAVFAICMMLIDSKGGYSYLTRSIIKVLIFGFVPMLLLKWQGISMPNLKKDSNLKKILAFGLVVIAFAFIVGYILLSFNLLGDVKESLATTVGVNEKIYPFVYIYIVFVNGPLEEFFFRYSAIKIIKNKFSYLISSFLFAIYHIGMLRTMFPWYLFMAMVLGLMIVGYLFIKINTREGSILNSIVVHMSANFAINTIGLLLIYELV